MCELRFNVLAHTEVGQTVCVVGDVPALGNWEVGDGLMLRWTEGDVWDALFADEPAMVMDDDDVA